MLALDPKYRGLGQRQLALLRTLHRRGPMSLSDLAEVTYGSRYRTTDVRHSAVGLKVRGLVVIERDGRSTSVSLAEE